MDRFNKRLKNVLVKNGVLTTEQADEMGGGTTESDQSLADQVIEQAILTEDQLTGLIAMEMKLPPVDLERVTPEEWALETMSRETAQSYGVVPVSRIGNVLTIATANPFDLFRLDDLALVTGCVLRPMVSSTRKIGDATRNAYAMSKEKVENLFEDVDDVSYAVEDIAIEEDDFVEDDGTGDSPVVKLVNLVVFQAIREKVSDIHIEPSETKTRVRYRKDGVLYETISSPKRMHNAIVSRIKIMAGLDIAEKRRPQDGKFRLKIEGRKIDFRVSVLPVLNGEKVVMRILDASNLALRLDDLGFEEKTLSDFRQALASPYGMVLVTGPTGSGKSTTLYSALTEMANVRDNTITVEDPVEYQLDGIYQVAVNPKSGLTFAAALRSILRQDPDIIMVGEIRDHETIEIAIRAALTGHLMLSTLHTNDAASSLPRMVDMGVDPFLVAASTILVSAQRLCRRLCDECKEPIEVSDEKLLGMGFKPEEIGSKPIFKPVGCSRCTDGYRSRFALLETILLNDEIRKIINRAGSATEIKEAAIAHGMITLRRAGIQNMLKGTTSGEEVLNVSVADVH